MASPKINIPIRLPDAHNSGKYYAVQLQTAIHRPLCQYKEVAKLFIVSNIKHHLRSFYKLLLKCRIIDQYFQWTFGEGHLVVFGNHFDYEEPDAECLWFLYSLEQKAIEKGGCVHFILGPHEIAHMNGPWRFRHPVYPSGDRHSKVPFTALYDANAELKRWLEMRNIAEIIDNRLFIHSTFLPFLHKTGQTISGANKFAHSIYPRLYDQTTIKEWFNSSFGVHSTEVPNTEMINDHDLNKFNVNGIIAGNFLPSQIATSLEGKLINVSSNFEHESPAGLFINHNTFFQVTRQGTKETIKI